MRSAYDELARAGQIPSAASVLKLTGGSKSTVVRLLRAVRTERILAKPKPDVPLALLQAVGEPLVRQLWGAAEQMAIKLHEARIADLTVVLNGMSEDLRMLEAAEDRIAELEEQLASREDFEGQLRNLKAIVEEMGRGRAPSKPAAGAVNSVLNIIVAGGSAPVSKQEIDRQMVLAGYNEAASQKARWHAVNGGFARIVGEAMQLTDEGKRKLKRLPAAGAIAHATAAG